MPKGFIVSSHNDLQPQFVTDMSAWIAQGKLQWRETVEEGIETMRRGIEEFLVPRGIRFFFVETHLVTGGRVVPAYGGSVELPESGAPVAGLVVRGVKGRC